MGDSSNWESTAQHYCIVVSQTLLIWTLRGCSYDIVSRLNLDKIFPFPSDLGWKQIVCNSGVSMLTSVHKAGLYCTEFIITFLQHMRIKDSLGHDDILQKQIHEGRNPDFF